MFSHIHRYVCSVLSEMRSTVNTINIFTYFRNKKILLSQIEEVQTCVNRMEAALEYNNDLKELHELRKELKNKIKALKPNISEDFEELKAELEKIKTEVEKTFDKF